MRYIFGIDENTIDEFDRMRGRMDMLFVELAVLCSSLQRHHDNMKRVDDLHKWRYEASLRFALASFGHAEKAIVFIDEFLYNSRR